MEAEEAAGRGEASQEEGGGGWREGRALARLHQAVVRRDPAGTNVFAALLSFFFMGRGLDRPVLLDVVVLTRHIWPPSRSRGFKDTDFVSTLLLSILS